MNLTTLPERFAVWKLAPDTPLPTPDFFAAVRTTEELSLVTSEALAPKSSDTCEPGWRAIKVQGPLDFSLVGILAALAAPLARAGVSIFAISTFDTDYLLVKEDQLSDAIAALQAEGHTFS
ncbi:MAG: ACT domain-containing protein [Armatimonas sp.]